MRRKIDVAEVEAATKIRAKYLRALEHEDFGLLPGPTFVKTFLRTYAEYLGLDAQLLVEEYRAQYEPRLSEPQPFVSPPSRRRREPSRRMRAPRGPPGPWTAVFVAVAVVVVIFAILGLTGGSGGGPQATRSPPPPAAKAKPKPKPVPPPRPTAVALHVVPNGPTYVCVDHGIGTAVSFQGIISVPRNFHGRIVRINSGKSDLAMTVNGKRFAVPQSAFPIGYSFTPNNAVPLAGPQRPCIATR